MINIIELDINALKEYENNPRDNAGAVEAVAHSIAEFGFKVPIIIDANNVIVAGHTRLKAAKSLNMEKVPCIVADDLTDEQIKAFRLADNKVGELATWDFEKLDLELNSLDMDMELFGFENISGALSESGKTVEEDNFTVELPKEAKSKRGDIYQLGNHRLMCGDSLQIDDVNKLLNGEKCELTFTDPPYELETQGGGILKNANSMKQIRENGVDKFEPANLIIVSDTNIYCHNKPLIKKYIELAEQNNMPYDLCFYKKLCAVPNYKGHMMTDCEYIAIIGKQDPNKGLDKELYSKCYVGKKDSDNNLSYSKQVELCAKYIKLYSKGNVLDLFGGSGSTLIACEQLNRTCYMMEYDPQYVDVIIDRWEKFTGQKAELIENSEVSMTG